MRKELEKVYNPKSVEGRLYKTWTDKKYFSAKADRSKTPYTIVIPPPNITGHLHLGHAMDNTIQDILIRWKRMQGYNALWIPGTDHASISTEVKIIEDMASEGLTKESIGREAFLTRAWKWKEKYGGRIVEQLKKLGSSCDWDRERFTMDPGLTEAVLTVFVNLYNKGLIYRGEKLINWCPKCKTTISDAEVDHKDMTAGFYHMKYKLSDADEYLSFATTRPETILGDTALAVNPKDERYAAYVGRKVIVPIVEREIPIVADEYVEMEFGTGVVKITPAHDPNDFEVGQRHNLPMINILNDDGTLNSKAGKYEGFDRYEARKKIVEEFKELGLFIKQEDITHAVGVHERCKDTVEPMLKLQWFVKMEELAKPAIEKNLSGELNFVSERYSKIYLHWLENIRDWCISRQLWWGHRIPAYYCDGCGEIKVAKAAPDKCPKCGSGSIRQDEDTLDTWFSSALWPFATLGWPEKTEDFQYFYPTNVLVTSYDIIFFWVVRMVFSGLEHTGELPFKDVLIHGLIRDAQGRKMSKSLGNGIDPIELIDSYGTDALRISLVLGSSMDNDSRLHMEKIEANRNFVNKIWNATRFIFMNMDESEPQALRLTITDKWIISKVNALVKEVTDNMEGYELGVAVQKIYDFIWDEYCDWYVEMVKPRLYDKNDLTRESALWTLKTVLVTALKLLHPYAPFVTEEIFTSIQTEEETIMLSSWPVFKQEYVFAEEENNVELLKEAIRSIRNLRSELNVPPSKKAKVYVVAEETVLNVFERGGAFFKAMAYAVEVELLTAFNSDSSGMVSSVISKAVIYIPFAELVEIEKEIQRLQKEREKYISEVERVEKKLANEGFVKKAPSSVIEEEKLKLEKYRDMLLQIDEQISRFK